MTERPSDIERAARVCEKAARNTIATGSSWVEGARKAPLGAAILGMHDADTGAAIVAAQGSALNQAAAAIRALPPSPLAEENARLIAALAECFRLSGAEPGSDDEWTLAARAVDAVRRLREDYDQDDPVAEAERRLGRVIAALLRLDGIDIHIPPEHVGAFDQVDAALAAFRALEGEERTTKARDPEFMERLIDAAPRIHGRDQGAGEGDG